MEKKPVSQLPKFGPEAWASIAQTLGQPMNTAWASIAHRLVPSVNLLFLIRVDTFKLHKLER